MAITLASDAASDAEITDGIGLGDLESAARLWVRHWPTALTAAREYVSPDEVPGLAAEALIATVSAIAIGRGPREDVSGFVTEAVRELGEDDEPPVPGPEHPAVFVSPRMTEAFAQLDPELQDVLRTAVAIGQLDEEGTRALTVLQHYYLAEHTDQAESPACRRAHIAMMSVADSSATEGVPRKTWLHMSTCAWCTEAFHEVAFSNVALGALVDPGVLTSAAAPVAPDPALVAPAVDAVDTEPREPTFFEAAFVEPVFVEPVFVEPDEPLLYDAQPIPEEDDDEVVAIAGAAHVGSRRNRLVAVGIAVAAAVSVVAVILAGQGDGTTTPTAAGTDTTTRSAPTDDPTTTSEDTGSASPSESATVAGPQLTPAGTATGSTAKPTTKPTKVQPKPSSSPSSPKPTAQPTTAQPTPEPTPTPTPTPKPCNGLQRLLGLC